MRRLILLPVVLLLPLLAACTNESDASPGGSPTATTSATPTPAQAVTSTPTPGQTSAAATSTAAPQTGSLTPAPPASQPPAPGPSSPPVFARPPAASAEAGGASVAMGIGTYCWSAAGSNGVCSDAAGPVTGAQELVVSPGGRVDVTTAFPGSEIRESVASAIPVSDTTQGKPIATGELVWNFPPIGGQRLATTIQPSGVSFPAPAQPGRYVVILMLRPAAGDVAYGLVLDVR